MWLIHCVNKMSFRGIKMHLERFTVSLCLAVSMGIVCIFPTSLRAQNKNEKDVALIQYRCSPAVSREGKTGKWVVGNYSAIITLPDKRAGSAFIPLGDAEKIDAAVFQLKKAMDDGSKLIRQHGDDEAERTVREKLREVHQLLVEPLEAWIDQRKHWIVIPDRSLWAVPFSALVDREGQYVIERRLVTYMTGLADVFQQEVLLEPEHREALLFADPDFDAPAKDLGKSPLKEKDSLRGDLDLDTDRILPVVSRLPGTRAEAEAVAKIFKESGVRTRIFTDAEANEIQLGKVKTPWVLWLSTHGFAINKDQPAGPKKDRSEHSMPRTTTNPWLRCGLLLAGCNQGGKNSDGSQVGVITGMKVAGLDLYGTNLVVLSACDTGVATDGEGEAVSGLRRCFLFAGARSVMTTLWQTPDRETSLLMADFVKRWMKGIPKADALREAQLARIKALRERKSAAHPFYWAAFTLTGQYQ